MLLLSVLCNTPAAAPVYDFDGDGTADFAVKRSSGANTQLSWHILGSRDGYTATTFGYQFANFEAGDATVLADYDGDGKTDIAVMRRSPSVTTQIYWYILNSATGTVSIVPWGRTPTDIQVPQDYDGYGKTDIAVRRNDYWWILRSSDGGHYVEKFGDSLDEALQGGDYDGDGKDDLAVVRRFLDRTGGQSMTTLFVKYSGTGQIRISNLGDARITGAVTGDYDGDGRADVAKWEGTFWAWERSSDGRTDGFRFGSDGDRPMPDDYDGDGKTDVAVFRQFNSIPGNSYHYFMIMQPDRAGYRAVAWGGPGDAPIFDQRYVPPIGF